MSLYASETRVPVEQSRDEIEKLLKRYGADAFGYATDGATNVAAVKFRAADRWVRFHLPMPTIESCRVARSRGRSARRLTESQAENARDKETRRRWRALALLIKAKLEAVATGIVIFEKEFLAHIVVPGGSGESTVGDVMLPAIADAYKSGKPLLLGTGSAE